MPTTNSVLTRVDVLLEACKVMVLDEVHSLSIELFDSLPDLSGVLVMVSEVELLPPMAKVSR